VPLRATPCALTKAFFAQDVFKAAGDASVSLALLGAITLHHADAFCFLDFHRLCLAPPKDSLQRIESLSAWELQESMEFSEF
jgi:hypothetical protein